MVAPEFIPGWAEFVVQNYAAEIVDLGKAFLRPEDQPFPVVEVGTEQRIKILRRLAVVDRFAAVATAVDEVERRSGEWVAWCDLFERGDSFPETAVVNQPGGGQKLLEIGLRCRGKHPRRQAEEKRRGKFRISKRQHCKEAGKKFHRLIPSSLFCVFSETVMLAAGIGRKDRYSVPDGIELRLRLLLVHRLRRSGGMNS